MQPVSRNPFCARARRALLEADHDPARLREPPSADRAFPPPARDTCGACPASSPAQKPPPTGHSAPRRPEVPFHSDRTFRLAQTEYSTRCRQAMLRTAGHSLRRYGHKKTGRQPTLGPARGTGYRDASSCRRPAICGKISAQITRRTGTARQPGQPVVQI